MSVQSLRQCRSGRLFHITGALCEQSVRAPDTHPATCQPLKPPLPFNPPHDFTRLLARTDCLQKASQLLPEQTELLSRSRQLSTFLSADRLLPVFTGSFSWRQCRQTFVSQALSSFFFAAARQKAPLEGGLTGKQQLPMGSAERSN